MHDYSKPIGTKKLRFRDWLQQKLDRKEIAGLEWIDRRMGLFKIPWKHGSRHGWSVGDDAEIFRQWALHSGRYKEGVDRRDPKKWKTNFRCTLNALPDFWEDKDRSCSRGPNAFKVYRMRRNNKLKREEKAKREHDRQAEPEPLDLSDKEIIQMVDDMMGLGNSVQKPLLTRRPNSAFPAFETLLVDRSRAPFSFSYSPWCLAAWNAIAVDQFGKTAAKTDGNPTITPADETCVKSTEKPVEISEE